MPGKPDVITMRASDRRTVESLRLRCRFAFTSGYAEASPSIADIASAAQQGHGLKLRNTVLDAIKKVGGHSGKALVLANAALTPLWFQARSRRKLAENPATDPLVRRAALNLMVTMGAAGFHPLPEYVAGKQIYWVHAKGREAGDYLSCRHRLQHEVATLHPHKPYGPALFGSQKADRLDSVAPDIVAYLLIEKNDWVHELGPIVYGYDEICSKLTAEDISSLMETKHSISPDYAITQSSDNGFGGVSNINVIGRRDANESGDDGRTYFRFIIGRMNNMAGVQRHLQRLTIATEEITSADKCVELDRGDILLVNNRRAATKWVSQAMYGFRRKNKRIKDGHRVFIRMSFYSKAEIT